MKKTGAIIEGFGRLFKKLGIFIAFCAAAVVISVIIVYPMWFFATTNSQIFSLFILYLLSGLVVFFLVRKILSKENRTNSGRIPFVLKRHILKLLFTSPVFLFAIIVLYLNAKFIVAIPLSLVFLALLGYLLFVPSKRHM